MCGIPEERPFVLLIASAEAVQQPVPPPVCTRAEVPPLAEALAPTEGAGGSGGGGSGSLSGWRRGSTRRQKGLHLVFAWLAIQSLRSTLSRSD